MYGSLLTFLFMLILSLSFLTTLLKVALPVNLLACAPPVAAGLILSAINVYDDDDDDEHRNSSD